MSKGKKIGLICGGVVVVLIAAVAIYGFVITKSGYWLLSKLRADTPAQKMAFSSASDAVRTIADEGFVLLQNDGSLLPIGTANKPKINLFGVRAIQLVFNGGGSTASDVTKCIKLEDALRSAGFDVNTDLLNVYYNFYKSGKISSASTSAPPNGGASEFIDNPDNIIIPDLPASAYNDTSVFADGKTLIDHARDFSDIAIVVIGRGGGEGFDIDVKTLQLTAEERAMFDAVCAQFSKVVLIINSANALEVGFVREYPSIKSVLWVGYPGQSGAESIARILSGTVNPSGRMADTWVTNNLSAPAANNFMESNGDGTWKKISFHYENVSGGLSMPAMFGGSETDARGFFMNYAEGIYVGYKYYETRSATDPSYRYDDEVVWSFGHGLSFTTFKKNIQAFNVDSDGTVTVRVEVQNTGKAAGKDVIQIYYEPPYTGKIEKSTVNLAAFKKTNLIAPGDTELYSVTFAVADMASFDDKTNKAYTLEKGAYKISLNDDAHTVIDSVTWTLNNDIIYDAAHNGKRPGDLLPASNRLDDAKLFDDYLTRSWNASSRAFTGPKAQDFTASDAILAHIDYTVKTDSELGITTAPETNKAVTVKFADLIGAPYNDPRWDEFISQLTVKELSDLAGNGAYQISGIDRLGVPRTLSPDGSTGIFATTYSGAIMGASGVGVTYPTPVVIASTWNEDIGLLMGTSVGSEGQSFGYSGWYAPSMNTHRTPFNGRNFEYYSEDGVLAGKIAAGVVKGATDKGMITFIKHFAMNERETSCRARMFEWATEQSIREIYLKPFEIAIKEGGALGIMSSFNYIGLTWAGGNKALLTDIVRGEWGFKGVIITDAAIHPHMNSVQFLQAGAELSLDILSAWGVPGQSGIIQAAAENPATKAGTITNLQRAAKNMLYAVSRSWKAAK